MAQKPIGYYGEFRPTGVDTSAARRFESLAGLADQVGDIATAFGKKKVAEQAFLKEQNQIVEDTKAARLAGNASAVTKTPLELREYENVETFKADQAFNQTAMAAYTAGIQNQITSIVGTAAANNPSDILAYDNSTKAAFSGLISATPEDLKPAFEIYFNQINRTAASKIIKKQKDFEDSVNLAEINTAIEDQEINFVNLARAGDEEGLINAGLIFVETGKTAIEKELITPLEFEIKKNDLKDRLANQSALGRFDRQVLRNEDQTVEQRIQVGKNIINEIDKAKAYQIEDPIDPGQLITLDAAEKDALVKSLEGELKDFEAEEIKKAELAIEASRFTQIQNYSLAQTTVQDPSIGDKEKLQSIAEAEMLGKIGGTEATKLRRYVNSSEALTAITNSDVMGDIIARAYDLNADQDINPNSNDYLQGVNNLRDEILVARTNGELTAAAEIKLNNQLRTLTAAKTAGATATLSYNNTKAEATIQESLPPDLWGVARRELLDAVNIRTAEVESERVATGDTFDPLTNKEIRNLWGDLAPGVVAKIKEERRIKAIERVNSILNPVVEQKPVSRFKIKVKE